MAKRLGGSFNRLWCHAGTAATTAVAHRNYEFHIGRLRKRLKVLIPASGTTFPPLDGVKKL